MFNDLKGNNFYFEFYKTKSNLYHFQELIKKSDYINAFTRQVYIFNNKFCLYVFKNKIKNFSLRAKVHFLCCIKL